MAIDPDVLSKQRLSLVRTGERRCDRCGRRTKDVAGTCRVCRTAVPKLDRLTIEQLTGIIEECRLELKRRLTNLDAAIEKAGG